MNGENKKETVKQKSNNNKLIRDKTQYISIREASIITGINPQTLRKLGDENKIKCYKTLSGQRKFDKAYLEKMCNNYDVNDKLTIIHGDAFTYYQQLNDVKFDVAYFDYWNFVDSTIYNDMETLKELYKNNIKETGQIMYWCEDLFTNGIIN